MGNKSKLLQFTKQIKTFANMSLKLDQAILGHNKVLSNMILLHYCFYVGKLLVISKIEKKLISSLKKSVYDGFTQPLRWSMPCTITTRPCHVSRHLKEYILIPAIYKSFSHVHFYFIFHQIECHHTSSVSIFYLKSLCPHNIMCLALFAPGVDTVFLFIEACKGGFDGPTINLSITPTTLLKQFPFPTKGKRNA